MKALRMPRAEVDVHLERVRRADCTAEGILAAAQAEADALRLRMEEQLAEQSDRLSALAHREAARIAEGEVVRQNAEAGAIALQAAAAFARRIERLEPWIVDLVRLALTRIAATLPEEVAVPSIVRQAMGEMAGQGKITLACAQSAVDRLDALRAENPAAFEGVNRVVADPELLDDGITLTGAGGVTEIGFTTQIGMLTEALSTALDDEGAP